MTAWELIAGSDTPGDRIEPWQYVGLSGSYPEWACLVDLGVGAVQDTPDGDGNLWGLLDASTPWTPDALYNAHWVPGAPGSPVTPGRYLAYWAGEADGTHPPTRLPIGWVPVEGPKFLGADSGGVGYWAGRVHFASTVPSLPLGWAPLDPATPLTYDGVYNGSGHDGPWAAGDYVLMFNSGFDGDNGGPHAGWPAGVTSLTSVCGPIAITDENAGGVIDDTAYVVSGYVYNSDDVIPAFLGEASLGRWTPGFTYHTGDLVAGVSGGFFHCIADVYAGTGPYEDIVHWTRAEHVLYWPYLERFDLVTKKWLPRIKLPEAVSFRHVTGLPSGAPGALWEWAGPYQMAAGTLEAPVGYDGYRALLPTALTDASTITNGLNGPLGSVATGASSVAYPAGVYWVVTERQDAGAVEDAAVLGDSIGSRTAKYYASEGGFAGVIDGKLYFGGGDGDSIISKEFFSYDPATQTFERLADAKMPDQPYKLDYCPYGVVGNKLYGFLNGLGVSDPDNVLVFDPTANAWSVVSAIGAAGSANDQIQGVEIGGKLYFVYDRVYVFDPNALTVEAKALVPGASGPGDVSATGQSYLLGGKIQMFQKDLGAHEYDPASDVWTTLTIEPPPSVYASQYVGVVHAGSAFLLNGIRIAGNLVLGVWALLAPSYTAPDTIDHLVHRHFSKRQAIALQTPYSTLSLRLLMYAGFSLRQSKTLLKGDLSMKALLRGGFDRAQAKALTR